MKAPSALKKVLITGASRGIGQSMVERFAAAGWRVAACARSMSKSGVKADFAFDCDVSDARQATEGVEQAVRALGGLDVLVNNAGLAGSNPLDGSPEADEFWRRILSVNLDGVYYMTRAALKHLPDGGRIVNIASTLALQGVADQTAYCAAKHGVLGFTRALAHAVAPRKITVNAVCPGWVRTEMARGRMKDLHASEEELASAVPLKRFIEPWEVADLAIYLASPSASGITGQALTIDGGSVA